MGIEIIASLAATALVPIASNLLKSLIKTLQSWQSRQQTVKLKLTSKSGKTIEIEYSPDMSPESIKELIQSLEQEMNIE